MALARRTPLMPSDPGRERCAVQNVGAKFSRTPECWHPRDSNSMTSDGVVLLELAHEELADVVQAHAVAEFTLGLRQPGDGGGLAVVDHDLALVAEDLEPVGSDRGLARGDETPVAPSP